MQAEWQSPPQHPNVEHVGLIYDLIVGRVDLDSRGIRARDFILNPLHFRPGRANTAEA